MKDFSTNLLTLVNVIRINSGAAAALPSLITYLQRVLKIYDDEKVSADGICGLSFCPSVVQMRHRVRLMEAHNWSSTLSTHFCR